MQLYNHQQELIDLSPSKHLLAFGTGTGKTLTALKIVEKKQCNRLLVLCPKSLKLNWKLEIAKWTNLTAEQYHIMSKEEFKKWYGEVEDGKGVYLNRFDSLIVDEAHYFYGRTSQMFKTLNRFLNKYRYEMKANLHLTATPYMSTPWNIYAAAILLNYKIDYKKFEYSCFNKIKMGNRFVPVIKPESKSICIDIVKAIGTTKSLEECVDVPEQIFATEYVDITTSQKTAIRNLTDELPIVKFTKCHQIAGGTLKSDGYNNDQFFDSEKLDRTIDIISQHAKIAVVCRYNNEIKFLSQKLSSHGRKILTITGENSDKRSEITHEVKDSDDVIVLIQAACSEGYSLATVPIMLFYSLDFSLKNYVQLLGRVQRLDNIKKNVYKFIVVKDTIDEDIYKSVVINKMDFQLELYKSSNK